jgi:hypothetical protein
VQPLRRQVAYRPIQVCCHRSVYIPDIGDYRLDTPGLQAIVGAPAHATGQQYLAIGDAARHPGVAVLRSSIIAVWLAGLVLGVYFRSGESMVASLIPGLFSQDLAILYGDYNIVRGATKMLANSTAVVGDVRYFHNNLDSSLYFLF